MQVTQISGEGLSRVFGVTIGAAELGEKLEAKIAEIAPKLNLRGFRPGKVPAAHVRRIYGKALMGELVEQTINETSQQVLESNGLRVAAQPSLNPQSNMDEVIAGKEDLAYQLDVEVMPDFEPVDVATLSLERPVHEPADEEIDEALAEVAGQSRTYAPREADDGAARDGDQLTIDFVGRIDGEAFEGGSGDGVAIVLGAAAFIPGFEDQLVGASAGDERQVAVTFPEDYAVERLRGKEAVFDVKVTAVAAPSEAAIDDALAERVGLSDLDALRAAIKANLDGQLAGATRMKVKRALLDRLDAAHDFPLPPKMVEAEFATIWREVEAERERGQLDAADAAKPEEALRAEYRKIAERRVRLGLVLAEIGRRGGVAVSDEEVNRAMRGEAMRYGNEAQRFFDFMRQSPQMQAQLRAPIFEDKVVDLILSRADVVDKPVTRHQLMAEDDLPEGYGEAAEAAVQPAEAAPAAAEAAAKPKRARAKKEAATSDAAPAGPAEAAPPEAEPAVAPEQKPARKKPARAAKAKSE